MFEKLWALVSVTPISEFTVLQILLIVALVVAAFFLVKWFFQGLWLCIKKIFKIEADLTPKARAKKITCKYCGRNLAECTCQKNRGLSYSKRLRLYYKEQRAAKKNRVSSITTNTTKNSIKK